MMKNKEHSQKNEGNEELMTQPRKRQREENETMRYDLSCENNDKRTRVEKGEGMKFRHNPFVPL
jgi:uncharacterized protein YcbX